MEIKSSKAFTLVEVLIAMLILAIGLLGLAGMTVVVMRSNMVAQQITEATNITTAMMEALKREAPRISQGCPTAVVNMVSFTAGNCDIIESSGISQLHDNADPWYPPANPLDPGCAVAGILTGDRTFDVTTSQFAAQAQSVNQFCDYDTQILRGQYVRYYRVIDSGTNERVLRAATLWVDRFGKWRQIHLETTVLIR